MDFAFYYFKSGCKIMPKKLYQPSKTKQGEKVKESFLCRWKSKKMEMKINQFIALKRV